MLLKLLEGDLQLVKALVAGLVHPRRLAGGTDEGAGEEIGQARVVLPVGDQAAQQIGPPQDRAVGGGRTAQGDVIAAAGAGVPPVQHEFFGAEPGRAGLVVKRLGGLDELAPGKGRMDVDLDDPGVRRDLEFFQPRIGGRRIAFQHHRHAELRRGELHRSDEIHGVLEGGYRRQKDIQPSVPGLDAKRRVQHHLRGVLARRLLLLDPIRSRRAGGDASSGQLGPRGHAGVNIAQSLARFERVRLRLGFFFLRRDPGQRRQRQPQAQGRIARDEKQVSAAEGPLAGAPGVLRQGLGVTPQGQCVADDLLESGFQLLEQALALQVIAQIHFKRVDVVRQPAFLPQGVENVLVRRHGASRVHAEMGRQGLDKLFRFLRPVAVIFKLVGEQRAVLPQRLPVVTPETGQRPARQRLARIPFSLAVLQHRAAGEPVFEPQQQLPG